MKNTYRGTFDSLSVLITDEIITKRKVMFLANLFFTYKALLMEFRTEKVSVEDLKNDRVESLELKIMNAFGDFITIETPSELHKKKLVYIRDINISELATEAANLQK